MIELLFISLPPGEVLQAIAFVLLGGVVVIVLASVVKHWKDAWRGHSTIKRLEGYGVWEAIRDIGIALFVAGIVSGIYEWSTRSIDENKKAVDVFNRINSYNIGEPVWTEIKNQVFHAPLLRRNVQIRMRISRDWTLPDGTKTTLPSHQAVLWMEYSYDLYPLNNASWAIPIQHSLDQEMLDQYLSLPHFERLQLKTAISPWDTQTKDFRGAELQKMVDAAGTLTFELLKLDDFNPPPPSENKAVRILTDRYEIISTPGQYHLTLPVLTAKTDVDAHTITLAIERIPDDIEAQIDAFYSGLKFIPDTAKRNWYFDGVMLPGHGFSVVFKLRAAPINPASPTPLGPKKEAS